MEVWAISLIFCKAKIYLETDILQFNTKNSQISLYLK